MKMSRRKQSKPRALKRGAEDDDEVAAMETGEEDPPLSSSLSGTTEESDPPVMEPLLSSVANPDPEKEDGGISREVAMATTEDEDAEEEYRCEMCSTLFYSLMQFMDHRNYDCMADIESMLQAEGGSSTSCPSSPYSVEARSPPLLGIDLPYSPGTAATPVDQLPHSIGANKANPYPCQFCQMAFPKLGYLKKHEQIHSDQMPYKCKFCMRLFKHKRSRDRHVKLHTGDRKYKCQHCDSAFSRSDHLKIHLKTHDNAKPYQCHTCQRGYTTAAALTSHMLSHKKEDLDDDMETELKCPKCDFQCLLEEDLLLHIEDCYEEDPMAGKQEAESKPKPHPSKEKFRSEKKDCSNPLLDPGYDKCPVCGARFVNMEDMYEHMKLIHHAVMANDPAFLESEDTQLPLNKVCKSTEGSSNSKEVDAKLDCPYCTRKGLATIGMLNVHIRTMHTGIADHLFSCQVCQVAFSSSSKLSNHMKKEHASMYGQHEELEIKFPCDYCPVEFNNSETLKHHKENVHKLAEISPKAVEVVYCSQCTMGFPHIYALAEHMHNSHGYSSRSKAQTSPGSGSINGSMGNSPGATPEKRGLHVISPEGLSIHPFKDLAKSPAPRTAAAGSHGAESYNCDHCNATFLDLKSYQVHLKNHVDPSLGHYTCSECHAEFTSDEQLENHVFMHYLALTTEYGCTSCLKLFSKPDELQKHLMDIHAHHLYRCSLCKEIFDSKVNIQVHFAIKHSNECKLYKCTTCGSVFRSEMEWQLHVKVQHLGISKPYRCFFCRESFGSESDLQSHLASHKKQYACPLCDEAFLVEYLLDKHMQTKHSQPDGMAAKVKTERESGEYDLNTCTPAGHLSSKAPTPTKPSTPKLQVSPLGLKHPGSHTSPAARSHSATPPMLKKGDLNYKCEICDVKFSDEGTLQKHRMHDHSISPEMNLMMQKNREVQQAAKESAAISSKAIQAPGADKFSQLCVYCNQTFKTKSELEKHMKTHVTPSNQKCNICDEIFPSASILAEHKLTHCKVVKGNICVVCKVAIKNEEQFYSHSQQHGFQGTNMQCVVCRQTLASMLELQMHGRHHFQNATNFFTCCVCLKSFDSKENLVSKLNTSGRSYYVCKPCYHGEQQQAEFHCSTCELKFESQVQLESHMLQHRKTFQCIKCQQSFATEYEIQLHVATHVMAEGNIHRCFMCNSNYESPAKLQCHLIEHSFEGSSELKCFVCSATFGDAGGMQVHVLEHGVGARHYSCTQCPQTFFFSAEYQNHMISHGQSQSSDYQCPDCPKTLSSLAALISHRKTHEKVDTSLLKCSLCDEPYESMTELQQHFFLAHSPSDLEKSNKKDFFSTSAVRTQRVNPTSSHKISLDVTSNGGKPFECPVCHKRFTRKENRKAHMKLHNSNQTQSCPVCNKSFLKRSHLHEHMKAHFGQSGSYACSLCSEVFLQSKHLRRHLIMVHNQAPDHPCQMCTQIFPLVKDLRNHLQQTHNFDEDLLDAASIGSDDSCSRLDGEGSGDDTDNEEDLGYHKHSLLVNGHERLQTHLSQTHETELEGAMELGGAMELEGGMQLGGAMDLGGVSLQTTSSVPAVNSYTENFGQMETSVNMISNPPEQVKVN